MAYNKGNIGGGYKSGFSSCSVGGSGGRMSGGSNIGGSFGGRSLYSYSGGRKISFVSNANRGGGGYVGSGVGFGAGGGFGGGGAFGGGGGYGAGGGAGGFAGGRPAGFGGGAGAFGGGAGAFGGGAGAIGGGAGPFGGPRAWGGPEAEGFPMCPPGGIKEVTINQSLLQPLNVALDPQITQVKTEEREKIKTLNDTFVIFIERVKTLEQEHQVLKTKWELLQQQGQKGGSQKKNLEPLFEQYINTLSRDVDTLESENARLTNELKTRQDHVEDCRKKYEDIVNKRTAAENEFVLLKKDVDGAYMNKTGLKTKCDNLHNEIEFTKMLHDAELSAVQGQISDISVILSMDNNREFDTGDLMEQLKAYYQQTAEMSRMESEMTYSNKFQELQAIAGQHGDHLKTTKEDIASMNRSIQRLMSEIEATKKQCALLEKSIAEAEERGENTLKDARKKQSELETACQKVQEDLARLNRDFQAAMNSKLTKEMEIGTYKKLLDGEEDRMSGNVPSKVTISVISGGSSIVGGGAGGGAGGAGGGYGTGIGGGGYSSAVGYGSGGGSEYSAGGYSGGAGGYSGGAGGYSGGAGGYSGGAGGYSGGAGGYSSSSRSSVAVANTTTTSRKTY